MSAWLYVVQTPEAAKTDPAVFKIGKTAQGPRARFGNYPKGTTLHFQTSVGDPDEAERLVLATLRASPEKFQPVPSMGREYFRCDLGDLKARILTTVTGPSTPTSPGPRATTLPPADEFVRDRVLPEGFGDSRTPLFKATGYQRNLGKGTKSLRDAYAIFTEWCVQGGHRRPNYIVFEVAVKRRWGDAVLVYDRDPELETPRSPKEWELRDFTYAFTSGLDAPHPRRGRVRPTARQISEHWALGKSKCWEDYPRCGWDFHFKLHQTALTRVPANLEVWRSVIVVRRNLRESPRLTEGRVYTQGWRDDGSFLKSLSRGPYINEGTEEFLDTHGLREGPRPKLGREVATQELYEDYGLWCKSKGVVRLALKWFEKLFEIKESDDEGSGGEFEREKFYQTYRWPEGTAPEITYDLYANEAVLDTIIADLRKVSDAAILVVPEDLDLDGLVDGYVGRGVPSVWREATARLREANLVDGRLKWC